jgi:hypothetical protein
LNVDLKINNKRQECKIGRGLVGGGGGMEDMMQVREDG